MKRVSKEEMKAKIKKNKKKIIIISCLSAAAAGLAGYSAFKQAAIKKANEKYIQGCIDGAKMLECYNYENIKHDVIEKHYDQIFDEVFNQHKKVDITSRKDGRKLYLVGDDQTFDFVMHTINRDQGIAAQVRLILNAKPGDVVQNF